MTVTKFEFSALHVACMEKKLTVVDFLLQLENIDVNAKTTSKNIPLHYLVRNVYEGSEKDHFQR